MPNQLIPRMTTGLSPQKILPSLQWSSNSAAIFLHRAKIRVLMVFSVMLAVTALRLLVPVLECLLLISCACERVQSGTVCAPGYCQFRGHENAMRLVEFDTRVQDADGTVPPTNRRESLMCRARLQKCPQIGQVHAQQLS